MFAERGLSPISLAEASPSAPIEGVIPTDEATPQSVAAANPQPVRVTSPQPAIVDPVGRGWKRVLLDIPLDRAAQDTPVWCWAACASMLHYFSGHPEQTQSEIATRIHGLAPDGGPREQAATRYEVMKALALDVVDQGFDAFFVEFENDLSVQFDKAFATFMRSGSWDLGLDMDLNRNSLTDLADIYVLSKQTRIVRELLDSRPVIAAMRESKDSTQGHIYLVAGAEYIHDIIPSRGDIADIFGRRKSNMLSDDRARDNRTDYKVCELILIDPWPTRAGDADAPQSASIRTISFSEFEDNLDWLMTREAATRALAPLQGIVTTTEEEEAL